MNRREPAEAPRDGVELREPLLTSRDVAERLRIPVRTLDHYAYMGIGPPFYKVGRHRRYDRRQVESWLESQQPAR